MWWLQLIPLRFDGHSTGAQLFIKGQWHNLLASDSHADLFIYLFRPQLNSPERAGHDIEWSKHSRTAVEWQLNHIWIEL